MKKNKIKISIYISIIIVCGFLILSKTWIFFNGKGYKPIEIVPYEKAYIGLDENPNKIINSSGYTIETRFDVPDGFKRTSVATNSIGEYIRKIKLKDDGTEVKYFNGKTCKSVESAVFDFDVGNKDLQQCSDSILRVYSEYYFANAQYDKINFNLTNDMPMNYIDWREGKRMLALREFAKMIKILPYDDSYKNFRKYLESLMNYAGTKSMAKESEKIKLSEMTVGDTLINDAHAVLVVDEAINEKGEKCWLFAQGYMPAQDFHVLENPKHYDDVWYYESEFDDEIRTTSYIFTKEDIYRISK